MTDPLIDKEELLRIITHEFKDLADPVGAADSAIAYLRSVLTPEALSTVELRFSEGPDVSYTDRSTGHDLYLRIFGED